MARNGKRKKEDPKTGMKPEKVPQVEVQEVIRDERTHKILGFSLVITSLLLLIALISYCFTWKQDQDKVFAAGTQFLFAENISVDNLLGRLGAWTSHVFMYDGFGLASFMICTLPFVAGVNLIFGKPIFSLWRNVRYTVSGVFFFSIALAFILPSGSFSYGGALGTFCSQYLTRLIGEAGTTLLLMLGGLSWFIWRFNPDFRLKERKPQVPKVEPAITEATTPETAIFGNLPVNTQNDTSQLAAPKPEPPKNQAAPGEPALIILTPPEESAPDPINTFEVVETIPQPVNLPVPPPPVQPAETLETEQAPPVRKIVPIAVREITPEDLLKNEPSLEIKNAEQISAAESAASLPKHTTPALVNQEPYDPSEELRGYKFPELDLLDSHGSERVVANQEELEENKKQILGTLSNFEISIQRITATVGPTVTLYEIVPAPGVRISRIKNLEDDIALSLAALGIRIIAPIPGKGTIGIEVPNARKQTVSMRSILGSEKFLKNNFSLPVALGKTISNEHFVADLASMPHLLMAGATGQGKSVGINALLLSLLYKKHPSQLKFVLIDPKKVELSLYRVIEKHFLAKLPGEEESIITDTKKVVYTLNALCIEMDNRYDLLKEAEVRNIREYNEKFIKRRLNPQKGHQYLPFIVLVIDEFADLIMTAGKEIEMPIGRLAQLARAVGIHLIIATQRPSVNIITGTIKANFPSRIAFKVSSKIDSRTILDVGGAEQLIGKGDMLISHNGELIRLQCPFVDTPEVERICSFIGSQRGYPEAFMLPLYSDEKEGEDKELSLGERDSLFEEAARLIVQNQMGSTSLIQRRMKLGYNRAGRLMDQLEAAGIVGPNQGSKVRDVLIKTEMELDEWLRRNGGL